MNQTHASETILLIGAGRMSPPVIDYFLNHTEYNLILADVDPVQAQRRAEGYSEERIRCIAVDAGVDSHEALISVLEQAKVAIGLVPSGLNTTLARLCIETGTHLVTTSYVNEAMWQLSNQAETAGVVILGETGLDPGLDHMEAMRVIHEIRSKGGRVESLISSCGGIPYNMIKVNPLDYKISWSPESLLAALRGRPAHFKQQGQLVTVAPERIFAFEPDAVVRLDGFMKPEFDSYPNGNAQHYIGLYGIDEAQTIIRKTLRYKGWNMILNNLHQLGWFSDRPVHEAIKASKTTLLDDATMETLDWLGLREDTDSELTAFQYFSERFVSKPELTYSAGERDLVILRNQIEAEYPDSRLRTTSTLTVVGDPNGYTAMQKTVGYTCAIAARLIVDRAYRRGGVHIPSSPALYRPVLEELAQCGVVFERTSKIV